MPSPVGQVPLHGMQVDPLRRFYSSLHEQIPESDMAKKWHASKTARHDLFSRNQRACICSKVSHLGRRRVVAAPSYLVMPVFTPAHRAIRGCSRRVACSIVVMGFGLCSEARNTWLLAPAYQGYA